MYQLVSKRFYTSLSEIKSLRKSPFKRLPRKYPIVNPVVPSFCNGTSIIQAHHPIATTILNQPTIIVERQIEMMNIFLGVEQSNRYRIMDVTGNCIGYMEERDFGFTKAIMRQFYRLHRSFTVDVFDNFGNILLTIYRPFSWINSHIKAILPRNESDDQVQGSFKHHTSNMVGQYLPRKEFAHPLDGIIIGETIQNWHLWRRRYELFQHDSLTTNEFNQFAEIDAPFLSFEFSLLDESRRIIGSVDRNWVGLGRELFTDTGVYIIRMDSTQSFRGVYPQDIISNNVLTLDQRAVLLANAVSIDFDYFSRHSHHGNGLFGFSSYND